MYIVAVTSLGAQQTSSDGWAGRAIPNESIVVSQRQARECDGLTATHTNSQT